MPKVTRSGAKIKQSPKRPAEERRRQLLLAAQRLFMKNGFRGTTTDQIAREAGLTKGAFYFHFRKKEDVLLDILNLLHQEVMAAFVAFPSGETNPADLLKALLDKHAREGEPEFGAFLDFWAEVYKLPKVRKHLRTCIEESSRMIVDRIDRRYGTPQERSDLAVMIFSLFDGLTVRSMMYRESVDYGRQARLLSRLMDGAAIVKGKQRK